MLYKYYIEEGIRRDVQIVLIKAILCRDSYYHVMQEGC